MPTDRAAPPSARAAGSLSLFATIALLIIYTDAGLRVFWRIVGGKAFHAMPDLVRRDQPMRPLHDAQQAIPIAPNGTAVTVGAVVRPRLSAAAVVPSAPRWDPPTHTDEVSDQSLSDACAKHEVLYGNLYSDLAPWIDRELRIDEARMRDTINIVDRHRGKWNSWVSDTLTPILILRGKVYLTLGPPKKDPTNYFWTVLRDLQDLARTVPLPDTELLLNFADQPVVFATEAGRTTPPNFPVFSYCKRARFLDILVPGYYTPDRVCREYRAGGNERHPWRSKRRAAFARYTHFCTMQKQVDEYNRPLPPCARSYFASLSETAVGAKRLDVHPLNVVNDTKDPSLKYGQKLLAKGEPRTMAAHGEYAYLLDTDGFSSAYKLQQLLATNSLVLRHRSTWRAYYYAALHAFVHYVPVWRSSSDDVLRLVDWLGAHDSVARRIALAGQRFACEHLTQPGRLCYWHKAIAEYTNSFLGYVPSLAKRPRAFPLDRLNIMCRIRDAPVVCYYNVKANGPPLPPGYVCEKPVPGAPNGTYEDCAYRGRQAAAI